jgi:hypothetical protein
LNCPFDDVIKSVSVQAPKLARGWGADDSGGSWSVVEQGQLSKGLSRLVLLEEGLLLIWWLQELGAVQATILYQVKIVTVVPLLNNDFTFIFSH